jgi:predicted transposase YbfD/YdcC
MPPVMVTAWSAMTRMALVNVLAPGNNEAAGALQLVELLQLKGCVVTADALHCHRGMAKAIVERGGDYVLAVKNNQPGLLGDAKAAISAAERKKAKQATTKDADHGRKETRTAIVTPVKDMAENHNFPGLKAVARITSKRGRDKTVQRYFLLTQCYTPAELLRIVREHWGIENVLHWTLDVVLDEDQARSRKDHAPANLAVLRRLALNIARAHPDTKTSLRGKLKRAAWDDSFLVDMLLNMR